MATKLEKAAAAWREVSPKDRGEVLIATGRPAFNPAWRAIYDLALAADVEPRQTRARKAATKTKAARKSRALKAVRT